MTFWKWSQIAASNANADSTINWAEGQAPSTINDSARAVMAAAAKYRDDMAGAIVAGGTASVLTVSSFQGFDTLAHLSGQSIAFTPGTTSAGALTLNVDGLGAKPLRPSPGVDFIGGELIQGTPYVATYNNSDGAFYVKGFMTSPYAVPIFGGLDHWDTIAPNSCFIFPQGQAISRTTYSKAFARWGTKFGVGDGSTTFNVPDVRGKTRAMIESAATLLTTAGFGGDSTVIGTVGGAEKETIGLGHLPTSITSAGSTTQTLSGQLAYNTLGGVLDFNANISGGGPTPIPWSANPNWQGLSSIPGTAAVTSNNTGANAAGGAKNLPTVQPTITCNYVIRII